MTAPRYYYINALSNPHHYRFGSVCSSLPQSESSRRDNSLYSVSTMPRFSALTQVSKIISHLYFHSVDSSFQLLSNGLQICLMLMFFERNLLEKNYAKSRC